MYNFFINDITFFYNNFTEFVSYLKKNKHITKIITPIGKFPYTDSNISYAVAPFTRGKIQIFDILKTVVVYFKHVDKNKNNIFITIIPIMLGAFVCFFKNAKGVFYFTGLGTVFISDKPADKLLRFFVKYFFIFFLNKKKNIIIVQNKSDYNFFSNKLKLKKTNIKLINGCGVDLNRFKYDKKECLNKKLKIFVPARLIREKGIKECVDASELLNNDNIEHEFIFSSNIDLGNPSSFTKKEIDKFSESSSISFIGFVNDIRTVYKESDIVCLPSYREGLPNSLLEASSIGRLIIASDVPGCNDIITDSENGLLFKEKSAEAIYKTISSIAKGEVDSDKLIETAFKKVIKKYSNEIILHELISIFKII